MCQITDTEHNNVEEANIPNIDRFPLHLASCVIKVEWIDILCRWYLVFGHLKCVTILLDTH